MATDSLLFDSKVEDINREYRPSYNPFYSIFQNAVKYDEINGVIDFKEVKVNGDISAKEILAQNTEEKHFGLGETKKTYRKTFYGIKLNHSKYEKTFNEVSIAKRVMDAHNKEFDLKVLNGAASNNGAFVTTDPNFIKRADLVDQASNLATINQIILDALTDSKKAGNGIKSVITYGDFERKLNQFIANTSSTFKTAIEDNNPNIRFVDMDQSLIDGASGFEIIDTNNVLLRYARLPQLFRKGINEEDEYTWYKFGYSSAMVDIEQLGGIVRQDVTFAS
ncbi:MAG: hypothetical protein LBR26_16805 [Prevotella sp.]|jgi:hypothetical protein|nr:hypothetical protein [Prevotella sp.]